MNRFELEHLPQDLPLRHEWRDFTEFYSEVHLSSGTVPLSSVTLTDCLGVASRYLGFCFTAMGVPMDMLSLRLFSNQTLLHAFFCFVWRRSELGTGMIKNIDWSKYIIQYLKYRDKGSSEAMDGAGGCVLVRHLDKILEYLGNFAKSLRRAFPGGKVICDGLDTWGSPVSLPSMELVVEWQYALKREALAPIVDAVKSRAADPPRLSRAEAVMLHDWALSELLAGHMPPIRLSVIRSLQASTSASQQEHTCSHPDCKNVGCRGNRMEQHPSLLYTYGNVRVAQRPTPLDVSSWEGIMPSADTTAGLMGVSVQRLYADMDSMQQAAPQAMDPVGDTNMPHVAQHRATEQPLLGTISGVGQVYATPSGGRHLRFASDDDSETDGEGFTFDGDDLICNSGEGGYVGAYAGTGQPRVPHQEGGGFAHAEPKWLTSSVPLTLRKITMVHQKMSKREGNSPVQVVLPYDLSKVMQVYEQYAYPVLNPNGSHNFLFMDATTGQPFLQAEQLTRYWYGMQAKYAAPWDPHFSPNSLRHVFVTGKVVHLADALHATGLQPLYDGHAAVMNNTAGPTWQHHYAREGVYRSEMARASVDACTLWRQGVLGKMHQQIQEASAALLASGQDLADCDLAVGGNHERSMEDGSDTAASESEVDSEAAMDTYAATAMDPADVQGIMVDDWS